MSIAQRGVRRSHEEWLELLDRSGPFLTLPVAMRTWPAGMDPIPRAAMDDFRVEHETWRESPAGGQRQWIGFVLKKFLEWGDCLVQGPDVPESLSTTLPEHGATVRADFAFRPPDGAIRLLGTILPPAVRPDARGVGGWSASHADRLAILLRRHEVPLGLSTDGRWWALVWAPPDGGSSVTVWDGALWLEERETLGAFRCLLERRRFLGVPDPETLPALLHSGLEQQEEITESLGRQVRQAVEMLVEAIGRAARQSATVGQLVAEIEPDEVYHGAVTVMMRLLFLLFAEERLLLPADDDLYLQSYSAGHLVDELRAEANMSGEEALEHRTAAWQRLLALFRGIHEGIAHDRLRIPPYGGVVFDPDRHPWLEGRRLGQDDRGVRVLPIDDRTVLHALEALQYVRVQGERRRLSFRTLDVEQIGYVYEGLLGYDANRANEPVLGLIGRAGEEPEVTLARLEQIGDDVAQLAELMGLSAARIQRLLSQPESLQTEQLLRMGTGGDEQLMARARPFAGLLRQDLRGLPVIVPTGGLYVSVSPRRRLSGTHYTPRDLAEKVVIGALEPLVYSPGPLDTDDRSTWRRRPSQELLDLKIVDIAMGSGAFLVSACRYLAGELLEARAAEGDTPLQDRPMAPDMFETADSDPVVVDARRQIIEHCLYGGDINPMAVEMAKLSLWLVSLSRERPFSFLDDRLVCGDSLLGLTSLDQLRTLHLDPAAAQRRMGEGGFDLWGQVRETLSEVERLRQDLREHELIDVRDATVKAGLLAQAEEVAGPLVVFADAMVGAAIASAGQRDTEDELGRIAQTAHEILGESVPNARATRLEELANTAAYNLDTDRPAGAFERRPTHWPLVFPEVFDQGGFDAVIGNPPFLGGQKLTGAFGTAYREYLVRWVADDVRGSADLVAYFLLIACRLLGERGQTGLIGTNTMAQGDTREVGLDQVIAGGASIRAAVKSARWPTRTVNLEYSILWSTPWKLGEEVARYLADEPVPLINSSLDAADTDAGKPYRLAANQGISFQGSIVLGMGFTMSPADARELIDRDARNGEVLFPYLGGEDLNSRPDCSASRWVISFRDWPLTIAERYPECLQVVRLKVKPERDGNNMRSRREHWWQFGSPATHLYASIDGMSRVIAITLHSKVVMPVRVPTGVVYSHAIAVFAYDDSGHLALLSSAFHYWWAIAYASTLETRIRYTTTDVFETFVLPPITERLDSAGKALEAFRDPLMLERDLGLTALYNQVHDSAVDDPAVAHLRDIHMEIDQAVADAYGWDDLDLAHGVHETTQGQRFTVSGGARREILHRLLDLNHRRHAEEEAAGLTPKGRKSERRGNAAQMTLIEP